MTSPIKATDALAEGRRIYVGNLIYAARTEDIYNLFGSHNYTIARLDMSVDPFTSRNPSYCFVELNTADEAERAMGELNGIELLGRPVKIKPCTAPRRGRSDGNDRKLDRYSQANEAREHWKPAEESAWRVRVDGLPRPKSQYHSEQVVARLFEGFDVTAISKVGFYEPSAHEKTKNYWAYVDFGNEDEAMRALRECNGMWFEGCRPSVVLARQKVSWKVDQRAQLEVNGVNRYRDVGRKQAVQRDLGSSWRRKNEDVKGEAEA
jgi:RNA recognition motif-containing protein